MFFPSRPSRFTPFFPFPQDAVWSWFSFESEALRGLGLESRAATDNGASLGPASNDCLAWRCTALRPRPLPFLLPSSDRETPGFCQAKRCVVANK